MGNCIPAFTRMEISKALREYLYSDYFVDSSSAVSCFGRQTDWSCRIEASHLKRREPNSLRHQGISHVNYSGLHSNIDFPHGLQLQQATVPPQRSIPFHCLQRSPHSHVDVPSLGAAFQDAGFLLQSARDREHERKLMIMARNRNGSLGWTKPEEILLSILAVDHAQATVKIHLSQHHVESMACI